MTPHEFRKIIALSQASLSAGQARNMVQEAYARDTNIKRRRILDEAMSALQKYEDMIDNVLDESYDIQGQKQR